MRLRCEVAIPSGFRQGRVLVQLRQPDPDVLLLLPAKDLGEATHQIVDACGMPLITHLAEPDPVVSGELLRTGYWEFAESMVLLSLARPGMTFVDAGANLGYYTVLLAGTLQADGQIYAFEPEARNHLILTANALLTRQLCPQAAPTEVVACALGDRVGNARLNVFDKNLGMHSLVFGSREAVSTSMVPVTTLDTLRWTEGASPALGRRIDLLKADVQGSELALLQGAEQTLERDRPTLCLEFEPHLSGPDTCTALVEWLQARRYTAFRLFHSNVNEPYRALVEAVRLLTAQEVVEQVRRKLVGVYGTLVAFPDAAAPGEAGRR